MLDGTSMGVTEWVILGAAIAAVLMIYLFTRRNDGPNPWRDMNDADDELPEEGSAAADEPEVLVDPSVAAEWENFTTDRGEPALDPNPGVDSISPAAVRQEPVVAQAPAADTVQQPAPARESESAGSYEKIVVLHVANRDGQMTGTQIHAALEACGLRYGPREIYHRFAEVNGRAESVFSIANMLKPGTLHPDEAQALVTRGLVMFMQLPGPVDGNKAFQDMLSTAQTLAKELGGVVLDDKRLPLTRQAAQYMIDDIAESERQHRLASV